MTAPVSSMQIVVGEQYRVLYDFVAHDEGELGVQSGDTVTVVELPEIESGWVLVENMGARTKKKGFVPLAYLGDLFDSQRDESTRRRADSSERRALLDTIPRHSQNPTQPATGPKREGSVSGRSENPDTLSAATAQYDQSRLPCDTSTDPPVMLLNDAYHRQLVRQRQEAFERMEQCLGAASQELRSCRDRNTQLSRKIREVESFLENERRRWKQRLDEESTMLGQKSTLLHMMPSSAVDSNF